MRPHLTVGQEHRHYRTGLDLCLYNLRTDESCNQGTPEDAASLFTPEGIPKDPEPWWGFAVKRTAGGGGGGRGLLMQRGMIEEIFYFNFFVLVEPKSGMEVDRAAFRVATLRDVEEMWVEDQAQGTEAVRLSEGDLVRGFWMERAPDMRGEGCKIPVMKIGLGRVTDVIEDYSFCTVFPVTGDGVAGWFTRQGFKDIKE
jgi:hypothetical protein